MLQKSLKKKRRRRFLLYFTYCRCVKENGPPCQYIIWCSPSFWGHWSSMFMSKTLTFWISLCSRKAGMYVAKLFIESIRHAEEQTITWKNVMPALHYTTHPAAWGKVLHTFTMSNTNLKLSECRRGLLLFHSPNLQGKPQTYTGTCPSKL